MKLDGGLQGQSSLILLLLFLSFSINRRVFHSFFPSLCVELSLQPPGSNSLPNPVLSTPFESTKLNISGLPRYWLFVLLLIKADTKRLFLKPLGL